MNCGSFYLSLAEISILLTSPLETASALILGAFTVKTPFSKFAEMSSTFTLSGNRNCLINRPLDCSTRCHWSVSCTSYLCLSLLILRLPCLPIWFSILPSSTLHTYIQWSRQLFNWWGKSKCKAIKKKKNVTYQANPWWKCELRVFPSNWDLCWRWCECPVRRESPGIPRHCPTDQTGCYCCGPMDPIGCQLSIDQRKESRPLFQVVPYPTMVNQANTENL